MNRPRPSVLAQFDPLLSEDPLSDNAEEEYDSEKENSVPDQFALLNNPRRDHAMPPRLTRRLVDVGDVTILDASLDEDENESSMEMQTPKRRPEFKSQSRTVTPRTPLAEIPVDYEPSPLPRKKLIKRDFPLKPSLGAERLPPSSSLSSLIDAVNLAGTSFARSHSGPSVHALPPEIKIQPSEPSLGSSLIQETPPPFDMAASVAIPRSDISLLAPRTPKSSSSSASEERARYSLDLNTSFNLQASDTSFDLLNDKISFLDEKGPGMMSFSNADETMIDFDGMSGQQIAYTPTRDNDEKEDVTPTQEAPVRKPGSPILPLAEANRQQSPSSPTPLLESENQPPADFAPIVTKQSLATPVVPRNTAPTIPALRVVKRAKRLDKPALVADTGLKKSPPSSDSEISSAASSRSGSARKSSSSSSSSVASAATRQSSPPSPTFKAIRCPGGPMRIPISESSVPGVKSTTMAGATKSTPPIRFGGGSGPRRVPLPEVSSQSSQDSTLTAKANSNAKPVRSTATKTTSLSGVPRPVSAMGSAPVVSRLPAPSGIARRKPTTTTTSNVGSNAPVRGPTRRYGFGQ
ncbi:hypothetical protein K435DRAFT_773525 [Dendrothele bispora CBS 962.96]|uniref:Uncharacterized protein n=1 Tax=Dendrothele bispora (strain CBS 962.96) TaxID=1314807 RepID=A0A4S8MSA0_DENBC|nr:hypothetical protein K435DRAFT_773525 [Dendrothele bispora CBS 962.96]